LQTATDYHVRGHRRGDADLQLICSNRQFGEILGLSPHLVQIGNPLAGKFLESWAALSARRLPATVTLGE